MAARRLLVGLTGTLAAGKSAALAEFARAGAAAISTDAIAHELSEPGGPIHRAVRRLFGLDVFDARGRMDRCAVAARVFRAPGERRRLEAATHPLILREARRRAKASRRPVTVIDAPLLFEARLEKDFDVTLAVVAARAASLRRAERRGMTCAEALARLKAQWTAERKAAAADVVIVNDGSLADLRSRIREYYRAFDLIARSPR